MSRRLFPLAALAFLAACETPDPGGPLPLPSAPSPAEVSVAPLPPRQDATTYLCADGTVVRAEYPEADEDGVLGRGGAILDIDGNRVRMIEGASASGVRYIGGGFQWWTKGLQDATLSPLPDGDAIADDPGTACRAAE
jgi:membrane-bound inhibitor of C-type lysozyme